MWFAGCGADAQSVSSSKASSCSSARVLGWKGTMPLPRLVSAAAFARSLLAFLTMPAIRTRTGGIRIAQPGTTKWSNIAYPERFAKKLAEVNTERGGRVVPVIKLAKAMADCFIEQEDKKIKGYHMESLAIDAFEDYRGPLDTRSMLNRLFRHSAKAVLSPIADSTGQSRCVDEYLGQTGSIERRRVSSCLGQMRRRVNACTTRKEFNALFCVGR